VGSFVHFVSLLYVRLCGCVLTFSCIVCLRQFDAILDTVGGRPIADYRRALSPTGVLVSIANRAEGSAPVASTVGMVLISAFSFSKQTLKPMASYVTAAHLDRLAGLLGEGAIKPVLDDSRQFGSGLESIPDAVAYVAEGHARGKVAVSLETPSAPSPDGVASVDDVELNAV
jgi:NADPH:quinone reductase-like Zn-dependent oxidoreductase